MNTIKLVLLDLDGVLNTATEPFSHYYARKYKLDAEKFKSFFRDIFPAALVGNADLKDLIINNTAIWRWGGDTDDLLLMWFEHEDNINKELVEYIQSIRAQGTKCYLATNQERHRTKYIQDVMLKGALDGFFSSSTLGFMKPDTKFFEEIIERLKPQFDRLSTSEIIYFDDDEENVAAAGSLGIKAYIYEDLESLKKLLS